jgi:hypothetical protein
MSEDPVVLCLNSGSSSLKFAAFRLAVGGETRVAEGAAERIGAEGGRFWIRAHEGEGAIEAKRPVCESRSCRCRHDHAIGERPTACARRRRPSCRPRRTSAPAPRANRRRARRVARAHRALRAAPLARRNPGDRSGHGALPLSFAGRLLRHGLLSRPARSLAPICASPIDSRKGALALRFSRAVVRVPGRGARAQTDRTSGPRPPRQRCKHDGAARRAPIDTTMGLTRGWLLDGDAVRRPRPRAHLLPPGRRVWPARSRTHRESRIGSSRHFRPRPRT